MQGELVFFDDQEIIRRSFGHQEARGVALGVKGAGGYYDVVQRQQGRAGFRH